MAHSPAAHDSQDALDVPEQDARPVVAPLLEALRPAGSDYVTPASLEERFDTRREVLFAAVELLRARGYQIEFHPYFGLRLVEIPDRFIAAEIQDELNTRIVGRSIETHEELASTNDRAWELIAKGDAPDGGVVLTEYQSAGRGRLGRTWSAPRSSSVLLSVILRQAVPEDRLPYLTAVGAAALAHTLTEVTHIPAQIKWPNDVMVHGRKIGGVIVEARSDHPDTFVLGLGLNVHQARHDLDPSLQEFATSIRMETGEHVNRNRLVRYILFYLDELYVKLRKKKYKPIAQLWREYCPLLGKDVLITDSADDEHRGTVVALDPSEGVTLEVTGTESESTEKTRVSLSAARIQTLRVLQ